MPETNPLVASGEYCRVYVVELEPGDVTAFDETVESVERMADRFARVRFVGGQSRCYGNPLTTILIRTVIL